MINGFMNYNGAVKLSSSVRKLQVLDLSGNKLNSSILPCLGGFPSVKHLYLGDNQFSGFIELNDIEALKYLEELDLSRNAINGFRYYNGCGNLTSLQKVDLSDNKFSGHIPSCLESWIAVQELRLSGNQFTGNIASSPLIRLLSIEFLKLSDNHFQIPHSFRAFANHTKLKYFVANSNQIIPDDLDLDSQPLVPRFQIMGLDLSNCGLVTYPPFFYHQHDLRYIDISDNFLQGYFPAWLLDRNPRLDVLILRNNSLSGGLELPSTSHAISVIDISRNKVEGDIPAGISVVFPQLNILAMSNNGFEGEIPRNLCAIKSLSILYLSNNHLSGGLGHIANDCFNLDTLSLSNNSFEGELPSFLGLSSLEFLDLSENNFSGGITANIFSPSLNGLILSNNFLEGPIPNSLCRLPELESLDLSHNMLNGTMPSCFLNSSQICFLYLNDNRLSGLVGDAFYPFLLATLDLSNNDLMGHIPAWIGNLTSLTALLLRGNQFHGEIPVQLCKLIYLSILDLSYNHLSGPIPPCLSEMVFSQLSSESNFVSAVDFGIEFLGPTSSILAAVDLAEQMEDLAIQNLREVTISNQLDFTTKSGTYTYSGGILRYLSGMDLSCNRLTGKIPPKLGNLSGLHALNLSHNNLWGNIPATFSNLKNVESLDLSYNSLSGSIPTELTQLSSLEVFKVVHNNLSGEIPFEAQFSTFDESSYEGNPFLCGPPLLKNCTTSNKVPSVDSNESNDEVDEDDGWLDMDTFYMSFAASSATMFGAVLIVLWINPYWRMALFYLAETCFLSCYYFIEDTIRKLKRVRSI